MDLPEYSISQDRDKGATVVNLIVRKLKRMIIDQELEVGDRIPNEFELSEKFGISRGPVREAIKILQSFGILDVRRGDGTYVRASASDGMFDALFFQIVAKGTNLEDLIQLRLILEIGILQLVVEQATREDWQRLRKANEVLTSRIKQGESIDLMVEADVAFHEELVQITKNDILKNVYLNMLEIFSPFIRNSYVQQQTGLNYTVLQQHELILKAIEERDGDLARYAVRASLKDWESLNLWYQDRKKSRK